MYVWVRHIHERVRISTCTRGSETEREHGYIRHPELGMRQEEQVLSKQVCPAL